MHTFIKVINGYKIKYWSFGDVYYIPMSADWIYEDKELSKVEEFAKSLKSKN
ncbi:hypothetical protein [Paenibacillus sp. MMO-177]|uniref:hypothetical protein n=1 Tax=Paenibacillus sp. MMO-177 TaxID=3081289 RepID=UPI00301A9358